MNYQKNILVLLALFLGCYVLYSASSNDKTQGVIRSDGRGYYAYLPALFIYGDNTYQASLNAEKSEEGRDFIPLYLHQDENGGVYNKFFPGVAILQAPFFATACAVSWLRGSPLDGYSEEFQFFFYLGSVFYAFIGLILCVKSFQLIFPKREKEIFAISLALYLATPLLLYITEFSSFSHLYSFALFGAFTYLILKISKKQTTLRILLLAVVLGLIFLVRPTNILIILSIPFLLGSSNKLVGFFKNLFANRGIQLIVGFLSFLITISLLFILWKWQTGNWIAWSYSGEGFNFFNPYFFSNLFSFRIGLFIHTPILLLSLIGLYLWYKENSFAAISWTLYFLINAWIISSWWCWDYESTFGNRPFTEHLIFLFIPLFYLLERFRKTSLVFFVLFSFIGLIRFSQYISGSNQLQRFTANSYFSSLQFWKKSNKDRWLFTHSCQPFGEAIKRDVLFVERKVVKITDANEYLFTSSIDFVSPRTNERLFLRIELDKKIQNPPLKDVFIVLDATSKDGKRRSYQTIELFNDRYEGSNDWKQLKLETQIYDPFHELDQITVYLWNKSKSKLEVKNISFMLETYKAD